MTSRPMADSYPPALAVAAEQARRFLDGIEERPVQPSASRAQLHERLGGPLPDESSDPAEVVSALAAGADPGLLGIQSPRFFGFVIGGAHPAALAADWLTSAWDQNAGLYIGSPAASVVERVVAGWLLDLLGLPDDASVGFVTGGQMATWTCLAAARNEVLRGAGWDVEADGLLGGPPVNVVVGAQRHGTVDRSLRFLGLGTSGMRVVPSDEQGRMSLAELEPVLRSCSGPTIVVAQAGNVNTGAVDPIGPVCEAAHELGAWVHIDGAFGLWAQASRRLRHLTAGVEQADSWSVDAHKWLNVPYDSGMAIVRRPQAHKSALGTRASYLVHDEDEAHDQMNWNPEHSRRARGFALWALLRTLGRRGVEALVDDLCDRARQFAEALDAVDGVEVLNDVVLNQVLVRFHGGDERTHDVIRRVQEDGTCWMSGTTWHGRAAMRISVSNWATTPADVDRSVEAILRCAELESAPRS